MSALNIGKNNFSKEVINSDKPVLLDFWASWCTPCQMIAPTIEAIAEERSDIKVGKVNVDDNMTLAQKYRVASIPTLLYFEGGELKKQNLGFMTPEEIEQWLEL